MIKTPVEVRMAIVREYQCGKVTQAALAAKYGLCESTVTRILRQAQAGSTTLMKRTLRQAPAGSAIVNADTPTTRQIQSEKIMSGIKRAKALGKNIGRQAKVTLAQRAEIVDAYRRGVKSSVLAAQYDINRKSVHRIVHAGAELEQQPAATEKEVAEKRRQQIMEGIARARAEGRVSGAGVKTTPQEREAIVASRRAGASLAHLAKVHERNIRTIWRICNEAEA